MNTRVYSKCIRTTQLFLKVFSRSGKKHESCPLSFCVTTTTDHDPRLCGCHNFFHIPVGDPKNGLIFFHTLTWKPLKPTHCKRMTVVNKLRMSINEMENNPSTRAFWKTTRKIEKSYFEYIPPLVVLLTPTVFSANASIYHKNNIISILTLCFCWWCHRLQL